MIMKRRASRTYIMLALGIVLVCATAFLLHTRSAEPSPQSTLGKTPSSYQELKRTWEDVFNQTPADAYADFLKTANTLPYSNAHTLAHIVGAILYDREGLAGIPGCTDDFAYGCYHGFAGGVIEKKGISGVREFADACTTQQSAIQCEHGIGHGLLAYLGSDKLIDALELCPQAPSGSLGGCYNGVFMEYFLSTLQRDKGVSVRMFDFKAPEERCASDVPEKFRPACYYELPAWWRVSAAVGATSYEEQFKLVGKLCASVIDSNLQVVCFKGAAAQTVPLSKYDKKLIQDWCSGMPKSGRAICLSEALNALVSAEKKNQRQHISP